MPDRDAGSCSLVREECDLVPQDLRIATLYQQWWKTPEVAKQRARIRMREVLFHVLAEVARDRVEMVTWLGQRDDVVSRITLPGVAAHGQVCERAG